MREQDTVGQLVTGAHYSLWALLPDASHFSACSRFPHPFSGGVQGLSILVHCSIRESDREVFRRRKQGGSPRTDSTFPPCFEADSGSSRGAVAPCVSLVVAFHHCFHVLFLKSLTVIISDKNTNNISLLSHAQPLQRFFTFVTSPEALRNKGSASYHTL